MLTALTLALALAQTEPLAPSDPPLTVADYEVLVIAEQTVSEARARVDARVREQGYRPLVRLGDRTTYWHPSLWKGRVMVDGDGWSRVRVPWIYAIIPEPTHNGFKLTFLTNDRGVRRGARDRAVAELEPAMRSLRDALAAREHAWRMMSLNGQLAAVWFDGLTPAGEPLPDPARRRAWLAGRYYGTADTPEGADVRDRIRDFVLHEVQATAPFTEAEVRSWPADWWDEPLVADRPGRGSDRPPSPREPGSTAPPTPGADR